VCCSIATTYGNLATTRRGFQGLESVTHSTNLIGWSIMAPSTSDYEKVPHADNDLDAPSCGDSDNDDAGEYVGRVKRRSLAEVERSRFDAETLGGHEEVERLLVTGMEKRRSKRARGELRRLEQGGKSETSSISGGDESPVRVGGYTRKVS
jgi:hypothetical protein